MENKLDVLTKKLYDEGIEKAQAEAEKIVSGAKLEAARLIAEAEAKANEIKAGAQAEADSLKQKAESEMALSARQAITALKQSITGLIAGQVAQNMAQKGFEDKTFVQELLITLVKKWDVTSGNLDMDLILSESQKKEFESYVLTHYKELMDKGLEIKTGFQTEGFVIQPKNGSYQIGFSESLFEAFFNQYMRSFTKTLLYK